MTRGKKPGKVDLENDFETLIASSGDSIPCILQSYRLGNEVSERQWEDVRESKMRGDQADHEYLVRTAAELK